MVLEQNYIHEVLYDDDDVVVVVAAAVAVHQRVMKMKNLMNRMMLVEQTMKQQQYDVHKLIFHS